MLLNTFELESVGIVAVTVNVHPEESWSLDEMGDLGTVRPYDRWGDAQRPEEISLVGPSKSTPVYYWTPPEEGRSEELRRYVQSLVDGSIAICWLEIVASVGPVTGSSAIGMCAVPNYGDDVDVTKDMISEHGLVDQAIQDLKGELQALDVAKALQDISDWKG